MTETIDSFERMVNTFATLTSELTPESIRLAVSNVRAMPLFSDINDETAEKVARRIESRHSISMGIGHVLTDADSEYEPWLDQAKATMDRHYWQRYEEHLHRQGFSRKVIASIDNVTDRTLGLLENPKKEGHWDRRGMVVGHVQSGKTANYIGLMTKAADAGYRLIVVIAGIHNHLRNQTQIRVDQGFVGRDSARLLSRKDAKFVGVGLQDKSHSPVPFTNSLRDFNKATATNVGISLHSLNEPAVFVIKKNASTLQNLADWLKEYSARGNRTTIDLPMLLIDDEADNASINTSKRPNETTRINGLIRDLLQVFERSSYIGYTATPFANIFIDPDTDDEMRGHDLFPRNFIISLDPPTNYFGPDRIFGDDASDVVRFIDDAEDLIPMRHKIDLQIHALPETLRTAVRAFVLARAVRLARGHSAFHSSMLVNASRFTAVQSQLRNEIHAFLRNIQNSIQIYGGLSRTHVLEYPELTALHQVWQDEYEQTGVSWEELHPYLHEAAAPISVTEINSRSAGSLNYADHPQGLNVIAVGGYSLSRGLTLEGLMVSYFHRNSVMYDTLMQMGRWFGYRPDYEDLCRVWMPEEAAGWYSHITDSMEQLRLEIRRMESVGATPEDFGLKVRSHPDTLMVTARNKMGRSEEITFALDLGGTLAETAMLPLSPKSHTANRGAAKRLVQTLTDLELHPQEHERGHLFTSVSVEPILEFIRQFSNSKLSARTDPDLIIPYITGRLDELNSWDVLLPSLKSDTSGTVLDTSLGLPIWCQRRTAGERTRDGQALFLSNRQRVASRGTERVGLSPEQERLAIQSFEEKPDAGKNIPDRFFRTVRKRPLLMVHLITVSDNNTELADSNPVVAWSISFPRTNKPKSPVNYRVNARWLTGPYADDWDEEDLDDELA